MGNSINNMSLADFRTTRLRVCIENNVKITLLDFLSAIRLKKIRSITVYDRMLVNLNDAIKFFNETFVPTRIRIDNEGAEKYRKCYNMKATVDLYRDEIDEKIKEEDIISMEFFNASKRNRKMFQ